VKITILATFAMESGNEILTFAVRHSCTLIHQLTSLIYSVAFLTVDVVQASSYRHGPVADVVQAVPFARYFTELS